MGERNSAAPGSAATELPPFTVRSAEPGDLPELTAMFELLWRTETPKLPKVIGCTIEYLRSGKPQDTFAAAQLVRQGRRVALLRVLAWQDDRSRPIASATVQFLIG